MYYFLLDYHSTTGSVIRVADLVMYFLRMIGYFRTSKLPNLDAGAS